MKIEIDQSGKIEQTEKYSILAFTNNVNRVIAISPAEKRILQRYFRDKNKPKMFVLATFSTMLFILLKDYVDLRNAEIYIDREYPGYDKFIKDNLFKYFTKNPKTKMDRSRLHIVEIGKKSRAHFLANGAGRSRIFNQKIKARDILKIVTKKSGNT